MVTKQRTSGGGMAKTCPKCGAELWDDGSCLPCDWRSAPAQSARYSRVQRGEQPSDWRRVPGQPARPSGEQPSDWRHGAAALLVSVLTFLLGIPSGYAAVGLVFMLVDPLNANPETVSLLAVAALFTGASGGILGLLWLFRGAVPAAWPIAGAIAGAIVGGGLTAYMWWYVTTHPLIDLGEGCFAGC